MVVDGQQRFILPLQQLLLWRFTSGLYYDVIEDPRAANELGLQFEIYTRALLRVAFPQLSILDERTYGTPQNQRRSSDCMVEVNGAVEMLIECKAKKVPQIAQSAVEETKARTMAVEELAKGVMQLIRFEKDLRDHAAAGLQAADRVHLVVVTLDDWIFTGPDVREQVFARAKVLADEKQVPTDRITAQEIILCTATEMDILVSRYPYDAMKQIFEKSFEGKYKHYAIDQVGKECFRELRHEADYPLKAELDTLLPTA